MKEIITNTDLSSLNLRQKEAVISDANRILVLAVERINSQNSFIYILLNRFITVHEGVYQMSNFIIKIIFNNFYIYHFNTKITINMNWYNYMFIINVSSKYFYSMTKAVNHSLKNKKQH